MAISWDCPACKLMNPISYAVCARCTGPRPPDMDPKRDRDPIRPRPIPVPAPKPQPESPKTPKQSNPTPEPTKRADWEKIALSLLPMLKAVSVGLKIAVVFAPVLGPVKAVVDIAIEAIKTLDLHHSFLEAPMTEQDFKEFTELEIAIIAAGKIIWKNRASVTAMLQEFCTDKEFQAKATKGIMGVTDIPAELKNITIGKVMEAIKAAAGELAV